jgi:hypothetical protein
MGRGFWGGFLVNLSGTWGGCNGRVIRPQSEDRMGLGSGKVGVGRVGSFEGE